MRQTILNDAHSRVSEGATGKRSIVSRLSELTVTNWTCPVPSKDNHLGADWPNLDSCLSRVQLNIAVITSGGVVFPVLTLT